MSDRPGRGRRIARWLCGFAMVVGQVAAAGVENSHHDMRLYDRFEEKSPCAYCHVPHAAAGEGLLRERGTTEGELGRVGSFCYTCHDGTVIPTAIVEAPDGTLGLDALVRSHGLVVANIQPRTGGLETVESVRASGLVAPDPATGKLPGRIECTACHDPHNSANPPFLKAPLEALCQRCHSGRNGVGGGRFGSVDDTGAANGPHPIGMAVAYSGKDRKRPAQVLPELVFNDVDPRLRVTSLAGLNLADPRKHWDTGGHLALPGAEGQQGAVMCSTCHSAHSVAENLLILPTSRSEQMDDPLCAGCHGAKVSPQNPGGTPYYHPAGQESFGPYATSTKPQRALKIVIPPDWPTGKNGALLCGTCHRAHQGRAGAKCLRDNAQGRKYSCDVCHQVDEDVTPKNAHHYASRTDRSALLEGRVLSWSAGPGEPGDLLDGLTCIDCHAGLAKSAHNW